MIGDKIKLRDGRKIVFTKANPTTTFNAIRNFAYNNHCEIKSISYAKTNSKYICFVTNNGLEVDLRCANHSKGTYDSDNLADGIDFDGEILSIDLALADVSAKNILQLIKECEIMMMRGMETPTLRTCPLMCQLKNVQQDETDNKDYNSIYNKSIKDAVKLFPFEELTIEKDGAIYHFGESIDVDVTNTPYIQKCINSGFLNQKQLEETIAYEKSSCINGYAFTIPNGMQIMKDREQVVAQRKAYINSKLNECICRIVKQTLNELKKHPTLL